MTLSAAVSDHLFLRPFFNNKQPIPAHLSLQGPLDFSPAGLVTNAMPTVRFITGGINPTLAYCATQDEVRLLSAVAVVSTVATKLFSMAKSWWGGSGSGKGHSGGKDSSSQNPASSSSSSSSSSSLPGGLDPKLLQPATKLPVAEYLDDTNRAVLSIRPDPQNKMAAVTDNLGRVLLVDITAMRVVRMWKGYRQAQVSWIEVMDRRSAAELDEDQDDTAGPVDDLERERLLERRNRIMLYLVIYAPRRGLLEVWQIRQGPRVAAFNVGTNCQLLQSITNPLGCWLGFGAALQQRHLAQTFILKQNGSLEQILVPFQQQ